MGRMPMQSDRTVFLTAHSEVFRAMYGPCAVMAYFLASSSVENIHLAHIESLFSFQTSGSSWDHMKEYPPNSSSAPSPVTACLNPSSAALLKTTAITRLFRRAMPS